MQLSYDRVCHDSSPCQGELKAFGQWKDEKTKGKKHQEVNSREVDDLWGNVPFRYGSRSILSMEDPCFMARSSEGLVYQVIESI
jgi:hypothetical protein